MSYLLDQQHRGILDGDRSVLKPNLNIILIVAPILLVIGLYGISGSANVIIHNAVLDNFGISAKGSITNKDVVGYGRYTHLFVWYTFTANDNRVYLHQTDVGANDYNSLAIGDQVDVKYTDGNPSDARINAYNPVERNTIGSGFVGGIPCCVVAIFGLGTAIVRWRRWNRLKSDGQVLEGRVISVKEEKDFQRKSYLTLRYGFYSPSGKWINGKARLANHIAEIKSETPIVILYVHDRFHQVL